MSQYLRLREQCNSVRNRVNRVLGFIVRNVCNRSADVMLRLYIALVKPHLDYAVQFWFSYNRMDIVNLEEVQRMISKMIQGIRNLTYMGVERLLN